MDIYALDSNVYIRALRDPGQLARLKRFLMRAGTRVRVAAVVAMELRAGARTAAHEQAVEELFSPYAERERVLVPSFSAYLQAGRVLSELASRERYSFSSTPSMTNDALLAASCREDDVVLVTENASDFTAIQRHLRGFRFVQSADVMQ